MEIDLDQASEAFESTDHVGQIVVLQVDNLKVGALAAEERSFAIRVAGVGHSDCTQAFIAHV